MSKKQTQEQTEQEVPFTLTSEQQKILAERLVAVEEFKRSPLTQDEKDGVAQAYIDELIKAKAEAEAKAKAEAEAKAKADEERRALMMPHDKKNEVK
jgi:colicin import membrane protein